MKRTELVAFTAALALFAVTAAHPGARAVAQMAAACPGGSTLLCGTDKVTTCTQIDQRTGQCSRWHEQTLYYYYAPDDGTGTPGYGQCGGGFICQY